MITPIDPVAAAGGSIGAVGPSSPPAPATSFARLLVEGVESVDQSIQEADAMSRAFALDDSIPVHQVTLALEQARLSFELLMQVRARMVEGYQEIMRMQL